MNSFRVFLFRDFEVRRADEQLSGLDGRKVQELFSFLLLNRERPHRREYLMALFWEESSEARAQKYLRQTLWQLQSSLDPNPAGGAERAIQSNNDWVQISPQANIWCDVLDFETAFLLSQGTAGPALNASQLGALKRAVTLYRGDLLEGCYQNWCLVERERLQNIFLMMLDKLIDSCLAQGAYEDGIAYGMRVLKQDYARERTHRRLMRLYSLLGDRSSALRQFELCALALRAELDVAPSEHTYRLFELIRRDKPLDMDPEPAVRRAPSLPLNDLLNHLVYLHLNLDEARALLQRDIQDMTRFLGSNGP